MERAMADLRACFVGDSFVAGVGDDSGLGWVGRAVAAARIAGHDLTAYNLGVRRDSSAEIGQRAESELAARLGAGERIAVVFAFGTNDLVRGVSLQDTAANTRALIAASRRAGREAFFVLPPVFTTAKKPAAALRVIAEAIADVCVEEAVPALDLAAVVPDWSVWWAQAAAGDGAHPNAEGYGLIADAFNGWDAWLAWLRG
jgi:acyl-CoA thioesterase-1